MKRKNLDPKEYAYQHSQERLSERYGLSLNKKCYDKLAEYVKDGTAVLIKEEPSHNQEIYSVDKGTSFGLKVTFVWDTENKWVKTFLPGGYSRYKKRKVSYKEYGELVNELTVRLLGDLRLKGIEYIYAAPRGGLPIAVHLSHYLNKEYLTPEGFCEQLDEGGTYLIVDDIVDTGRTFDIIDGYEFHHKRDSGILYASLFYKPQSEFKPDHYVEEITNDTWIVFPWEMENEKPNR